MSTVVESKQLMFPDPEVTPVPHELTECQKVPYTAYFSGGPWSWLVRCPQCGKERRQVLNVDGRLEPSCSGLNIGNP